MSGDRSSASCADQHSLLASTLYGPNVALGETEVAVYSCRKPAAERSCRYAVQKPVFRHADDPPSIYAVAEAQTQNANTSMITA